MSALNSLFEKAPERLSGARDPFLPGKIVTQVSPDLHAVRRIGRDDGNLADVHFPIETADDRVAGRRLLGRRHRLPGRSYSLAKRAVSCGRRSRALRHFLLATGGRSYFDETIAPASPAVAVPRSPMVLGRRQLSTFRFAAVPAACCFDQPVCMKAVAVARVSWCGSTGSR